MPRRSHTLLRALLLLCTLGLIVPALASPGSAAPTPAATTLAAKPDPDGNPNRAQRAIEALERVQDLLAGTATTESLTLELRDLSLLRDALSPAGQRQADALLARPTDPRGVCRDVPGSCYKGKSKRICSTAICVHWVPKHIDDRNGARRPFARKTLKAMTHVHRTYVAAGYRKPKSDGGLGGNSKPDVYLSQIGNVGYYGYCTSDDPKPPRHGGTWGYCVLDNDYRSSEFPVNTPLQNMKVTAAHEYFHNVQFAHDYGEHAWFMEATATWSEDEVYDKINDNVYYLPYGPIGCANRNHPNAEYCYGNPWAVSLNTFSGSYHYGTWIFFRYLTDRYGTDIAGMNDLVLKMWRRSTGKDPADRSIPAITSTLVDAGTDLDREFALFSAGNRRPSITYSEEVKELAAQGEGRYPVATLANRHTLSPADGSVTEAARYLHLTSRSFRFVPDSDNAPGTTLGLTIDFDTKDEDSVDGGTAVITVKARGSEETEQLVLTGGAQPAVTFDDTIQWVEVTIANPRTTGGTRQKLVATAS